MRTPLTRRLKTPPSQLLNPGAWMVVATERQKSDTSAERLLG